MGEKIHNFVRQTFWRKYFINHDIDSRAARPDLLILEAPDPGLATFYREPNCDASDSGQWHDNGCLDRLAPSLGQRVHLGKILIDWEEKKAKEKAKSGAP
jgi:hypothetical protein